MWSLRYALVRAADDPDAPAGPRGLRLAMPHFREGITDNSMRTMQQALAEGWEPFSVVHVSEIFQMIWFRRLEEGPAPSVEELPGQYL